jgi:peptide/nickel transport system substrate-binding protein
MRTWRGLAIAAVAVTLQAGCSGSQSHGGTSNAIDPDAVIRTGRGLGGFTTLDPAFNGPPVVAGMLYDRLTQFDGVYSKIYPELATSWAFNSAGTALDMQLRTDVKFHDGSPLDSAAVVANINRYKTLPGSKLAINLSEVTSVQATGTSSVRFNLVSGQGADLPALLSQGVGLIVNPKFFDDPKLGTAPPPGAGSGPYIFKSLTSTEVDVMRAPGKFWDPTAGLAKEIDVVSIPNTSAGVNAFLSGDLAGTNVIADDILEAESLIKSRRGEGTTFPAGSDQRFLINPKVAPFTNLLLRQAVQAAIDKQGIINGAFGGNGGCLPDDQPVPPSHATYDQKFVNTNPYSVTAAKAFLTQAGMPNGFSFTLEVPNFATFPPEALAVQGELAKVGITANLKYLDPATYNARLNSGQWQAFAWGGNVSMPDPQNGLMQQLLIGGPSITIGTPLESAAMAFNTYLADPRHSVAQRNAQFHDLYKWLNDQAIDDVVCSQVWVYMHGRGVIQGEPAFPSGSFDLRYLGRLK